MDSWLVALVATTCAVAAAIVVVLVANVVLMRIGRRIRWVRIAWLTMRRPTIALLVTVALWVSLSHTLVEGAARDVVVHALLITVLVSAVWFLETVVVAWLGELQERLVDRRADDVREQRSVTTQMRLVRRLVAVAFVVVGAALVLLTFPGVERIGAAMLASAGVLSVVLGIAAQTTLGNLFAGLQLAFTDAIRIGDIVEVDGTWSTIEDITLTYVVVSIWDERHKVLPSTYFTTTPFINWSRTGDTVTGTVYLTLDWRVDLDGLRREFERVLEASELWDGRAGSILVTDSTGDRLTVRALVTSANTDDDWTLRCHVRERLVTWLRENNPESLPVQRVLLSEPEDPADRS